MNESYLKKQSSEVVQEISKFSRLSNFLDAALSGLSNLYKLDMFSSNEDIKDMIKAELVNRNKIFRNICDDHDYGNLIKTAEPTLKEKYNEIIKMFKKLNDRYSVNFDEDELGKKAYSKNKKQP